MKCPEPGCGKTGLKGHQGVAMHIGRVHTGVIKTSKHPRGPRKALIAVDGEHVNGRAASAVVVTDAPLTRRRAEGIELVATKPKFEVNGCPNCMFPLKIMNDALEKRGIPLPPYCPACTMPVEIVRTSLRVVRKQTVNQPEHDHQHA